MTKSMPPYILHIHTLVKAGYHADAKNKKKIVPLVPREMIKLHIQIRLLDKSDSNCYRLLFDVVDM